MRIHEKLNRPKSNEICENAPCGDHFGPRFRRPGLMKRIALLLLTLCAACSGTTPEPTGEPIDGVTIDCRSPDADGDGLPDCEEAALGTSPRTNDTDGDGLTDFEEVVDRNFDPASNNFRFNPRIADLPQLAFEISALPDIRIDYTTTEGTTTTRGVERTNESARTVTTSQTQEYSHAIEETLTTSAQIGIDSFFGVSGSISESMSQSMSWTDEQTRENRRARTDSESFAREQGVERTGGSLRVTLGITNRGYQSVTIDQLVVAALRADPRNPGRFTPVANLDFESANGFPPIEIGPNAKSSDQLIFAAELDLDIALALLEDSRNLVLEPAVWSASDIEGRSFNAPLETIGPKCARISIDYGPGPGGNGRPVENYFVSAVTDFERRSITAREALEQVLRVPFETSAGVTRVRDVEASGTGRWIVAVSTSDGVSRQRTLYDPNTNPADLDAIELRPESVLGLVYVEDNDGDGLLARDEFLAGASDESTDTDGDGLDDFEEAKIGWEVPLILDVTERVFSSPVSADLDIDGLEDGMERALGTNPNDDDTDRDGLRDDLDDAPADVSPAVYLPMDGDATAAIGDDFTNQGATPATDRHGNANRALRFDGASVVFGDVFDRKITTGAAWSMWIRPETLEMGVRQGLLDHDPATFESWNALWVSPEGVGGTGTSYGRFIGLVEDTNNVTSGWHHVVGVLVDDADGFFDADTFQIYYDGVLVDELYYDGDHSVDAGMWRLGGGVGRTSHPAFEGLIDDVRIYGRSVTPREVRALFEAR